MTKKPPSRFNLSPSGNGPSFLDDPVSAAITMLEVGTTEDCLEAYEWVFFGDSGEGSFFEFCIYNGQPPAKIQSQIRETIPGIDRWYEVVGCKTDASELSEFVMSDEPIDPDWPNKIHLL